MTSFLALFSLSSAFAFSFSLPAANPPPPTAAPLPALKISTVTVSGISSGAFMAVQFGVAHSSLVHGVGTVAGGPYWCAEGDRSRGQKICMSDPEQIDSARSVQKAKDLAREGRIDDTANLRTQRVYLFQGTKDQVVRPPAAEKLKEFFAAFGSPARVQVESSIAAGHGFPTPDYGVSCERGGLPWLLKCQFDGAGEILKSLIGPLVPPVEAHELQAFDQKEFGSVAALMADEGWLYVPVSCARGESCALHVALHGCQMSPEFTGDKFAVHAGYNRWAESNRIVVLYPSAAKSKENPFGCWDWYGYTGSEYVTKDGAQIKALRAMVDRLSGR